MQFALKWWKRSLQSVSHTLSPSGSAETFDNAQSDDGETELSSWVFISNTKTATQVNQRIAGAFSNKACNVDDRCQDSKAEVR